MCYTPKTSKYELYLDHSRNSTSRCGQKAGTGVQILRSLQNLSYNRIEWARFRSKSSALTAPNHYPLDHFGPQRILISNTTSASSSVPPSNFCVEAGYEFLGRDLQSPASGPRARAHQTRTKQTVHLPELLDARPATAHQSRCSAAGDGPELI
jgi:hypothetical protein